MRVPHFVEDPIQQQVGYLTPRSFLYAVDYFARAFGFTASGGRWNRAHRLSGSFAASRIAAVKAWSCTDVAVAVTGLELMMSTAVHCT